MTESVILRATHSQKALPDGSLRKVPILITDVDPGIYVHHPSVAPFVDIPFTSEVILSYEKGNLRKFQDAGEISCQLLFSSDYNESATGTSSTGYSHTGAFAGKPLSNSYVWESGVGIPITQEDVDSGEYKVFSLDRAVHLAVDQPYWTDPVPGDPTDIGLFAGANLPMGVTSLFDYSFDYDAEYPAAAANPFSGSIGRVKLNECRTGDQLRVRFDFNVIPQVVNTTIEPALWYANRDASDAVTFTFDLTSQPIFYGNGTVGNSYLNRVEISAWITSTEDLNALTLPAIRSDNQIIIQPLGMLVTILR